MILLIVRFEGRESAQRPDSNRSERNLTPSAFALVAQWIERLVAVQKVAGPIPAKRTTIFVLVAQLDRAQASGA